MGWPTIAAVSGIVAEGDEKTDLDPPANDAYLLDDEPHQALPPVEVEVL